MPFEPKETIQEPIDLNTEYAIAEIEIILALPILRQFVLEKGRHSMWKALEVLHMNIQPHQYITYNQSDEFYEALTSKHVLYPSKHRVAQYMNYYQMPYSLIAKVTNLAPNTIQKTRYSTPVMFPAFAHWNPEMLANWNKFKEGLNIFNLPQPHAPNLHPMRLEN